jgi:hypothetical protein
MDSEADLIVNRTPVGEAWVNPQVTVPICRADSRGRSSGLDHLPDNAFPDHRGPIRHQPQRRIAGELEIRRIRSVRPADRSARCRVRSGHNVATIAYVEREPPSVTGSNTACEK